jgi:hypothetical protein
LGAAGGDLLAAHSAPAPVKKDEPPVESPQALSSTPAPTAQEIAQELVKLLPAPIVLPSTQAKTEPVTPAAKTEGCPKAEDERGAAAPEPSPLPPPTPMPAEDEQPSTPPQHDGDEQDDRGFVKDPKDRAAYMKAKELIDKHSRLLTKRNKRKELWTILDSHPQIRRWKPTLAGLKDRGLYVHRGDWAKYEEEQDATIAKGLQAVGRKGHWRCKACRSLFVDQAGQARCPKCDSSDIEPVTARQK